MDCVMNFPTILIDEIHFLPNMYGLVVSHALSTLY